MKYEFDTSNGFEVDLDELAEYCARINDDNELDNALEAEVEEERDQLLNSMRDSLTHENYQSAARKAFLLRNRWYMQFKEEIDDCICLCADHDVESAMIYQMGKHIHSGRPDEKAFPYLKKLGENGYIQSFKYLADCYYNGIGCETDRSKADKYYFEGMLFDRNRLCRKRYAELHPDLEGYDGDNLIKKIISGLAFGSEDDCECAHVKMAELILDGQVKEYPPEAGYVLLKAYFEIGYDIDGYRLGQCVLQGIGTDADPLIAERLLDSACDDLKWTIERFDDSPEWLESAKKYWDKNDYINAYEQAKRLNEEAKAEFNKLSDWDVYMAHDGIDDEDFIYDIWRERKPTHIVRNKLV